MGFWDLIFKKKPAEKTSTSVPVGDPAADKEQSSDVDLSFSRKYGPVYSSEDLTEEEKAAIRKRIEERYPNVPNKPYLKWDEVGFRNSLDRVADALNIDTSRVDLLPVGYLQTLMRRVLDNFLILERAKDISIFFDKIDFIKRDLKQLAAAEINGVKFSYSPSLLLWNVEIHARELFEIVLENSSSAQMDKICSLKTDLGRMNSNQRWKSSLDLITQNFNDDLESIIQDEFEKLEKAREEMKSEV